MSKKQLDAAAACAADLQGHLRRAQDAAAASEARALADADARLTPAWRRSGLPSKASHLQLDAALLLSGGGGNLGSSGGGGAPLIDPARIVGALEAQRRARWLSPPPWQQQHEVGGAATAAAAVFTAAAEEPPHHLQQTANLRVRHAITKARAAARAGPGGDGSGSGGKEGGWSSLPPEQLHEKVAAADARRAALAREMSAAQWEDEER